MDWTIQDVAHANHNPDVVVNGQAARARSASTPRSVQPMTLDARGQPRSGWQRARPTHGSSIRKPGQAFPDSRSSPGPPVPVGGGGSAAAGGIPSAPRGGPPEPQPRVILENANTSRVTVTPRVPGTTHIILAVEDNGQPTLTSYRRVILTAR